MTELFSMNENDFELSWNVVTRPSVRAVIIRDGKALLMYSKKYDYYKFPGGGLEKNESYVEALIREVLEESGYTIILESVTEYGTVTRRQKDRCAPSSIFEQKNYYYFCDVEDNQVEQQLDSYEEEEGFTPVWIAPLAAFTHNRKSEHGEADPMMIKRDTRVLDLLDKRLRNDARIIKEREWVATLGKPYYQEMLDFVEKHLEDREEGFLSKASIRYSRFDHIKRVLSWTKRLYELSERKDEIDIDLVYIAAIFHDVGKNDETKEQNHAQVGEIITREYLEEHGYAKDKTDKICYLVGKHSDKHLMRDANVSPELVLLMEADLMDDMGALGIVIDCMIEGASGGRMTFADSLDHIARFTLRQIRNNPMVTTAAKKIWEEKRDIVEAYYASLQRDVEIFR